MLRVLNRIKAMKINGTVITCNLWDYRLYGIVQLTFTLLSNLDFCEDEIFGIVIIH